MFITVSLGTTFLGHVPMSQYRSRFAVAFFCQAILLLFVGPPCAARDSCEVLAAPLVCLVLEIPMG